MAGFGETLRQARAHKGVSLKEAEQATRITRHYLAALEDEEFSALPQLIYQRGFVRNYSMYLDLDPGKMLDLFEESRGPVQRKEEPRVTAVPPLDMPSHWAPNFAIIAFSVVLSAIVFAWVYTAYIAPPPEEPFPTPSALTPTPMNDVTMPAVPKLTEETSATETPEGDSTNTSGGGDNQVEQAGEEGSGDGGQSEQATESDTSSSNGYVKQGEFDTTIQITAEVDLQVTFWVNGQVVFEGELKQGETTPAFPGSTFKVETSSGAATTFTNGCGESYTLGGDNMGPKVFEFDAGPDSCQVDPSTL